MKVQSRNQRPGAFKGELLICLVNQSEVQAFMKNKSGNVPPSLAGIRKDLKSLFTRRKFKGKSGEVCAIEDATFSIVIYGFEPSAKKESTYKVLSQYRKLGAQVFDHAKRRFVKNVGLSFGAADFLEVANLQAFLEGLNLSSYQYDYYREKKSSEYSGISTLLLLTDKKIPSKLIENVRKLTESVFLSRDLINMPPNDCPPRYLVEKAKEIAKNNKLAIEIFDRKKLQKINAGALLAVSQGSDEPPFLVKLTYSPIRKSSQKIALVGKGITFDSGGLSIKTASGMEDMKDDMSGAAAVLGAMNAIAQIKPNVEVTAYIPTCENMINGKAVRPGDVVKSLSGKTIEILNTDAEGRLILADALALAENDGADIIVDVATLTGAIMVALGTRYAGLFTEDSEIAEKVKLAGEKSGEHFWHMPLAPEYKDLLKSRIADIKNTGGRFGGAITAALFLKAFVKKARWAHLDIAGVSFEDGDRDHIKRGGVGFGVATLTRFVQSFENN